MQNKSEIPVNVKVTSKATVGADTTLVSTKKAAEDSTDTAKPAMWLAAVAAVKDNAGTLEYTTATDKTVAGLVGTEDNITALEQRLLIIRVKLFRIFIFRQQQQQPIRELREQM